MTAFGGFAVPGQGAAVFTTEREIIAQGFESQQVFFKSAVIDGASRDAGNSPTTVLRPGLLLGKITTSGKYTQWSAIATDGSQFVAGILWKELRAQDFDANNTDRAFTIIVSNALLQASQLLVKGVALTSATDEYLARRQLHAAGCRMDDDPVGYKAGVGFRFETQTGTTHTVTAGDNGKTFAYSNVAAVAVTLPTIVPGLEYDFIRTADEEIVVASAEGDNMIIGNDLSADSITFTTASQQIGARVRIKSIYVGSTLKWLPEVLGTPFGTGTVGMVFSTAT